MKRKLQSVYVNCYQTHLIIKRSADGLQRYPCATDSVRYMIELSTSFLPPAQSEVTAMQALSFLFVCSSKSGINCLI